MKKHVLEFGSDRIVVEIGNRLDNQTMPGGRISSNLKDGCTEPAETCIGCAAIDGLECLILGHALAGIDVTTEAYKEGVQAALDAIGNS